MREPVELSVRNVTKRRTVAKKDGMEQVKEKAMAQDCVLLSKFSMRLNEA